MDAVKNNKLNILLAEDEPSNQLLIERYLEKAGHTVTVVGNGQEALNLLDNHSYHLCIFDMQMPEMTGLEAIALYKKKKPNSKLPFIILTANTEKSTIDKCKQVGVDMYLAKPIVSATLVEAINSVFGKHIETTTLSSQIIDVTGLDYFDDPVSFNKFIELFEDSADKLIKDLKNALDDNYETFKNVVHSIKGLSGNIAAHTLREMTIQAENLNNDDYQKNSGEHYNKIANELFSVKAELVKLYK